MYNVNQQELVEELAKALKEVKAVEPPEWSKFVKTGTHKQRPPMREDWWYIRSASILRSVAKLGLVGVEKLRVKYGGKKRRGYKSERMLKGSGKIIRTILQQLEKAGFVKQEEKAGHKGRAVTKEGIKFINEITKKIKHRKPEIKEEIKEGQNGKV